MKTIQERCE